VPFAAERRGSWVVAPAAERRISALRADVLRNLNAVASVKGAKPRVSPAVQAPAFAANDVESGEGGGAAAAEAAPLGFGGGTEETKGSDGDGSDEDEEGGEGGGEALKAAKDAGVGHLVAVEKVLRVLPRGSHFGEAALVSSARRSCNVRARAFCEVQILTRAAFEAALFTRPDERRVVKALLLQRCSQEDAALQPAGGHCASQRHPAVTSPPRKASACTGAGSEELGGEGGGALGEAVAMQELARRLGDVERQLTEAIAKRGQGR
jgi:hypothetical protein